MTKNAIARLRTDDSGVGLVEIVVSMFLLALVAMALLPILIQALLSSETNATSATAGQLVNQQLDGVRLLPDSCEAVQAYDDSVPATATDSRGTVYQPHRQVGACPAAFPGVIQVEAWVTESGETNRLAGAVTFVYLSTELTPVP